MQNNLLDIFFFKYNLIKNMWYFFLTIFNWKYEIIKIKISKFFINFLNKNIVKNLFILKNNIKSKLNFLFFKKLNLIFLKNKKFNFDLMKKKKFKKFSIRVFINRNLNTILKKKLKVRIPFFIFNKYKKNLLVSLIFYFIKIFSFKMNFRAFISYHKRLYLYLLKRIYVYIKFLIKKLFYFLYKQYNLFFSLICWNDNININKIFFYYLFYYNYNKNYFLEKYKVDSSFNIIFKFKNFNFLLKINFNLFIFNKNKNIKNLKIIWISLKKNIKNIKIFTKFQYLIKIKNFLYFFIIYCLIIWLNNFLNLTKLKIKNFFINYNYFLKNFLFLISCIKRPKWKPFTFLKINYYIYNNISKNFL
jgi:hypothetical protein